jgi:hypothetical protein
MYKRLSAVLYCLGLVIGGLCVPRSAEASNAQLVAFEDANAAIRDQLSRSDSPAPSMTDPAYAKHVSEAFNVRVVKDSKNLPIPAVLDLCSEVVKTEVAYTQRGLKRSDVVGTAPQAAAARTVELANENSLKFQDEIALALRFSAACMALEATQMTAFAKQLKPDDMTPARRAGFAQIQRGLVQIVSGIAISQLDPVRPVNRQIMLDALADNIGPLAAAMTKASRESSLPAIDEVLSSQSLSQDSRAKLIAIRQALSRPECIGLCAI